MEWKLTDTGFIRPGSKSDDKRCWKIWRGLSDALYPIIDDTRWADEMAAVVETPFGRGIPQANGRGMNTAVTGPVYGMAVGAALVGAVELFGDNVLCVKSNEWTKNLKLPKADAKKLNRVRAAQLYWNTDREMDGDIADAALLAFWATSRVDPEVKLIVGIDPSMTKTGWAVARRVS